jgi:hypothetical protein
MKSTSDFVARFQQLDGQSAHTQHGHRNNRQADPRRDIALTIKAVSETINHVKEGV